MSFGPRELVEVAAQIRKLRALCQELYRVADAFRQQPEAVRLLDETIEKKRNEFLAEPTDSGKNAIGDELSILEEFRNMVIYQEAVTAALRAQGEAPNAPS